MKDQLAQHARKEIEARLTDLTAALPKVKSALSSLPWPALPEGASVFLTSTSPWALTIVILTRDLSTATEAFPDAIFTKDHTFPSPPDEVTVYSHDTAPIAIWHKVHMNIDIEDYR
jgi:hypothetical protein